MEVKVTYKNGMQFEAETRGHKVVCDQPVDAGGEDGGMTPPEFLLVSLGTCAMYYVAYYLKMQKISAEGMTVKVEADKAMNPPRLGRFVIAIDVPAALDERQLDAARRSAEKCLVKNTLMMAPEIELAVRVTEAVA